MLGRSNMFSLRSLKQVQPLLHIDWRLTTCEQDQLDRGRVHERLATYLRADLAAQVVKPSPLFTPARVYIATMRGGYTDILGLLHRVRLLD